MDMAARAQGSVPNGAVKDRLEEVLRDALRPVVGSSKSALLDEATEVAVDAVREAFKLIVRRPAPRKETRRAKVMRLPEVGVSFDYERYSKVYKMTVVGEHDIDVEYDGKVERHHSLKAVAMLILGYQPPIGGWQFFFGRMDTDEVSAKYGRRSA